ncbi:hypothetical protein [Sphingobacterium sp. FBM7-1]|uniref:hypothetical protein n=1 Tax=Sphingobacterium sp. FBM7-1 TaxID=2886688 RepID=UPI001D11CFC3|nr:hypothetical protein [Sphingobacterium sp. FBM7-1]MCC2598197.1 hypothetical protein [Sphingobacterium sp. FBM7-1]
MDSHPYPVNAKALDLYMDHYEDWNYCASKTSHPQALHGRAGSLYPWYKPATHRAGAGWFKKFEDRGLILRKDNSISILREPTSAEIERCLRD